MKKEVKLAYEFFEKQKKIKGVNNCGPLKHVIEKYFGEYISKDDVIEAAKLHPEITGEYPKYNISRVSIRKYFDYLNGR